ncbi:MAG TPA: pyridoxine 5'-phosphate synthase [Thermoanaerobaculia bacterium]|nr:pyridoxine 5'-phosphate synthase [Thermoanaerobaculia bacterium]
MAASTARLSVNVDHVATLRQARRAAYPDPVDAARIAEDAGASGITVHLRVDRRHIQDRDVERLRETVRGKLNLEMSTAEEMVAIALRVRPDQVTLVPERPDEVTTEGGLDVLRHGARIAEAAGQLGAAGVAVSLFVDPDLEQIQAIGGLSGGILGFEINTDAYTRARDQAEAVMQLDKVAQAAALGRGLGLHLYAGHGLRTDNVRPVASLPGMEELNIGHFLVSRAVMVGMDAAVREMLAAMGVA